MDGEVDEWMDKLGRRMDGWVNGWMDRLEGRANGRMNEWMGEWMDELEGRTNGRLSSFDNSHFALKEKFLLEKIFEILKFYVQSKFLPSDEYFYLSCF